MFSSNNKISIKQFRILLVLDMFSVGIILLPRYMAGFCGNNGYIPVISGTLIISLFTFILSSVISRFENLSFFQYTSKLLSRPIGYILSLLLYIKIIISTSLCLRIFCEILNRILLPQSPVFLTSLLIIILCFYTALMGYETRARMGEILIFILLVPLFIIYLIAGFKGDFTNLFPVLKGSNGDYLKAIITTFITFSGVEYIFFSPKYVENISEIKRASVVSVMFTGLLCTVITLICISLFTFEQLKDIPFPTLEVMDAVKLEGAFIERQEALMISFFVSAIYIIISAGVFFSSLLVADTFNKSNKKVYTSINCLLVFVISMFFNNLSMAIRLYNIISLFSILFFVVFLPFVFLIRIKTGRFLNEDN